MRIRLYAGQFKNLHLRLVELGDNFVIQTDSLDGTAAVNKQDFFAELGNLLAQMVELSFTEINLCCVAENKIFHC